jgi:endonuclease-8
MPEGDTIHQMARRIREVVDGRVPERIAMPHPRHRGSPWPERLRGRAVRAVDAHGKHLFMRFEGGLTLHSHLRMTGHWAVYGQGARWGRSPGRAWLVLGCAGFEVVEFDGPVLELLSEGRIRSDPRFTGLGQDVLGERFHPGPFLARLRALDPARPIGDALLDQHVLAGIGNLWKAEVCFATGIDPWRALGAVGDDEALELVRVARELMRSAAREGFRARPEGVYGRAGRPCPRCGTIVRRRGQWENNRSTFWCPGCQS